MNLVRALRLSGKERLAFVGSGGKSTALFQIARQLIPPVIVTATTHLAVSQARLADRWIIATSPEKILQTAVGTADQVVLFTGEEDDTGRTQGVESPVLDRILELADKLGSTLLIEADGSRQLPAKAPEQHEPAIPAFCNLVVVVVGLAAIGKPLDGDWVHRPEIFSELSKISHGEKIGIDALARVLLHSQGGLKHVPAGARRVALLNQADTRDLQAQGMRLAELLLPAYDAVLVASLAPSDETGEIQPSTSDTGQVFAVHEKIAAIILAAGGSRRYGEPKLLLPWKGEAIIRHVAKTALSAGLDPVILVAGDQAAAISQVISDLNVVLVENPDWETGQSSSLKSGMNLLSHRCGGAVFFLGDQPQIPASLVRSLVERHVATLSPIVAPLVDGQRGNPVLFDRVTFKDLMVLRGDVGGRPLFARYSTEWITWHDSSPLIDIDTPEDYERLASIE